MGLVERRKIKDLQDNTFQARAKEIVEITGIEIPYDVDWDSFSDDMEALAFLDNISCHRINMALRVICGDDIGKEAIVGLKRIKLKNVKTPAEMLISFTDGVLEMHCAYALRTDGMFGDLQIQDVLNKNL